MVTVTTKFGWESQMQKTVPIWLPLPTSWDSFPGKVIIALQVTASLHRNDTGRVRLDFKYAQLCSNA